MQFSNKNKVAWYDFAHFQFFQMYYMYCSIDKNLTQIKIASLKSHDISKGKHSNTMECIKVI